jgi:hypothetical protein
VQFAKFTVSWRNRSGSLSLPISKDLQVPIPGKKEQELSGRLWVDASDFLPKGKNETSPGYVESRGVGRIGDDTPFMLDYVTFSSFLAGSNPVVQQARTDALEKLKPDEFGGVTVSVSFSTYVSCRGVPFYRFAWVSTATWTPDTKGEPKSTVFLKSADQLYPTIVPGTKDDSDAEKKIRLEMQEARQLLRDGYPGRTLWDLKVPIPGKKDKQP